MSPLPIKQWIVGDYVIRRERPNDDYWFYPKGKPAEKKFAGFTLAEAKHAVAEAKKAQS